MAPFVSRTLQLKKNVKARYRYIPIKSDYLDATKYFYDQEREMIVGKSGVNKEVHYVTDIDMIEHFVELNEDLLCFVMNS